jgi:hypothetical protein
VKFDRWTGAAVVCAAARQDDEAARSRVVHDDVWAQTGLGRDDGCLCLADLARRLGRPLRLDDFTTALVNRSPATRAAILDAVTGVGCW